MGILENAEYGIAAVEY